MPPAPIFSGGRHLRVQVVSVTSSTVRRMGSPVGAGGGQEIISMVISQVNEMRGGLSSLQRSIV